MIRNPVPWPGGAKVACAITFDMDADMARAPRRRLFDQLVKDKTMMGGFPFPFPALGTLEMSGNGYQFKPLA